MTITCTVCPMGCEVSGIVENGVALELRGNRCQRGLVFARAEMTCPVRILTTVVKTGDTALPLLPVRSDQPIPREKISQCMAIISVLTAKTTAKTHEILVENILNTGANIIVTK